MGFHYGVGGTRSLRDVSVQKADKFVMTGSAPFQVSLSAPTDEPRGAVPDTQVVMESERPSDDRQQGRYTDRCLSSAYEMQLIFPSP